MCEWRYVLFVAPKIIITTLTRTCICKQISVRINKQQGIFFVGYNFFFSRAFGDNDLQSSLFFDKNIVYTSDAQRFSSYSDRALMSRVPRNVVTSLCASHSSSLATHDFYLQRCLLALLHSGTMITERERGEGFLIPACQKWV